MLILLGRRRSSLRSCSLSGNDEDLGVGGGQLRHLHSDSELRGWKMEPRAWGNPVPCPWGQPGQPLPLSPGTHRRPGPPLSLVTLYPTLP